MSEYIQATQQKNPGGRNGQQGVDLGARESVQGQIAVITVTKPYLDKLREDIYNLQKENHALYKKLSASKRLVAQKDTEILNLTQKLLRER